MEQNIKQHIELEEMIEFVCYNGNAAGEAGFLSMSNKINCHIYKCDVCKKKYYSILEFYDVCQDKELDYPEIEKELKEKFKIK